MTLTWHNLNRNVVVTRKNSKKCYFCVYLSTHFSGVLSEVRWLWFSSIHNFLGPDFVLSLTLSPVRLVGSGKVVSQTIVYSAVIRQRTDYIIVVNLGWYNLFWGTLDSWNIRTENRSWDWPESQEWVLTECSRWTSTQFWVWIPCVWIAPVFPGLIDLCTNTTGEGEGTILWL